MTIECAILGLLSERPLAGYDVKKRISDSPVMPWSGNNNQIYKALSALLEDGCLVSETIHQDGLPTKKVYTITDAGRRTLRLWLAEPPEPMELRKPLLLKLRWMGMLGARALDAMLLDYKRGISAQLGALQEEPQGDDLDAALRALVARNLRMSYQTELDWVERARQDIAGFAAKERDEPEHNQPNGGNTAMQYEVMKTGELSYLRYRAGEQRPEAMHPSQIVGDCIGERCNRVLIEAGALPEGFFRLSTGVAGDVLQKLAQYRVKTALLMDAAEAKGKFKDMMIEANRGDAFRTFSSAAQAEAWLMGEGI